MKFEITQHTLAGTRPENQDRIATMERGNMVLMVLADGLGGHRGGEQAADALVHSVTKAFQKLTHDHVPDPSAFMVLAILAAHRVINARSRRAGRELSARSTCVLCLVQDGYAYWAHVGDSRIYHIRDESIVSRTTDHTTVEQLREDGVIDQDSSSYRKMKHQLLQCVGGPMRPQVSVGPETRLQKGDTLLLCSDGLWQAVRDRELARYLGRGPIDEAIEDLLIKAENRMHQKCDNISAVAFRWLDRETTARPRLNRPPTDIDQDLLWHQIRGAGSEPVAADKPVDRSPARKKPSRRKDLEASIRDIESFIDGLDDLS